MRLVLSLSLLTLFFSSGWTQGWIPSDELPGRPQDGKLKCYECNSDVKPLCSQNKWKFANQTVRRVMEKQCPRRVSAFCYIKKFQNDSSEFTMRGCFRDRFKGGIKASVGCFNMGTVYRVCLSTGPLSNSAHRTFRVLPSLTDNSLLVVAFYFITSHIRSRI